MMMREKTGIAIYPKKSLTQDLCSLTQKELFKLDIKFALAVNGQTYINSLNILCLRNNLIRYLKFYWSDIFYFKEKKYQVPAKTEKERL